ncbi:Transposable element P transposase [Frankliniella fusca]|uniref:Transposable element P transposase n=1 Tax=Frankliniella fusca TaxID=407009 RepID=A0AAE1LTS9_9NEOP|nr:Transposable element P transposase [Frankliniella fusca]
MGANVVAIVCDMGNRGLLSALGFCTRKDSLKWCIPNPVNPDVKVWCVPDPVHVFKSMKECLCANRYIQLHQQVVAEYGLPSDMVDIEHIEWLEKFQRDDSLQLVPGLTLKDLSSSHFSKMKVKSSLKVVNPRTSAALKYLVVKGLVPEAFETTAWFLKVMNRWFQLMSSRNPQCALGLRKEEVHTQALEHLRLVISVFKFMEIPGGWKPVQSHVIFATEAILEIENHLINQKKYEFLKTGTFTTDVVENINSCIRIRNPNPTPLECKTRLKHIAISQFQMKINSSSYNYDGAEDYVDLLVQSNSSSHSDPQHDFDFSSLKWIGCVPDNRKSHEDDVCYRICGYVVISLNRRRILLCKDCIQKLRHSKETPHPHSLFLMLTDFIPGAQFPVIDEVFQLLRLIEHNLIVWLPKIRHLERLDLLIESIVLPATAPFHLPTCHSVKDKLVKAFTVMRFRQLALSDLSSTEKNSSSSLASKTAGGHYLAHNYRRPTSQITPRRKQPAASLKRTILYFF